MSRIEFEAPEYQNDGAFQTARYAFEGDEASGWVIERNGSEWMRLGPGYTPVQTLYCGVCSTDLARRFLPYPLPQIIGHEVVGRKDGKAVAIEINASHAARGLHDQNCPYCRGDMNTQCPARITLGIDRLPGGFAPWVLAPIEAIVEVPQAVSLLVAALTEPFAAALQGVEATRPREGERVAVLGPRRLGSLVIAALHGYRIDSGVSFQISALARHRQLLDLAGALGADKQVLLGEQPIESLYKQYDIVFDTTGAPAGFELALRLARRVVHLKSTNGQTIMGLQRLTDMVVDEIALLPFEEASLDFRWPIDQAPRENKQIYAAPDLNSQARLELDRWAAKRGATVVSDSAAELVKRIDAGDFPPGAPYPRFDLAVADSPASIDTILRPTPPREMSLVRARGAILVAPGGESGAARPLFDELAGGLQLHSSRCGDFHRALRILANDTQIVAALEKRMISAVKPLAEIDQAFALAADSERSVKVLVQTDAQSSSRESPGLSLTR